MCSTFNLMRFRIKGRFEASPDGDRITWPAKWRRACLPARCSRPLMSTEP